jgi:hypothetical protein
VHFQHLYYGRYLGEGGGGQRVKINRGRGIAKNVGDACEFAVVCACVVVVVVDI